MISYNPKDWFHMLFALHKSDTMRMLWKQILYIGFFTLFITFIELNYFPNSGKLEKLIAVYSLVGFVISMLLIFRTNTAYERWWEGRKKWGELVNDTRNISIKLASILENLEDRDFFKRMIPNFVFASKEHLRDGVLMEELELKDTEIEFIKNKNHIPLAIAHLIYQKLIELVKIGKI